MHNQLARHPYVSKPIWWYPTIYDDDGEWEPFPIVIKLHGVPKTEKKVRCRQYKVDRDLPEWSGNPVRRRHTRFGRRRPRKVRDRA